MASPDDLPFKLGVEQGYNLKGRGTIIMGRFLQGTISRDTELELVARDEAGNVRRTRLECVDYSSISESDWDRSKPVAFGVVVHGISADEVIPGSFLQAVEK